jgi:thymidine kinase
MSLKIIMGNMFSGKTSELIRRLKRYRVIGKKILVINSKKDTRASEDVLRTHDNVRFDCIKTNTLDDVDFSDVDVIAIDEAQFLPVLKRLLNAFSIRVKLFYSRGSMVIINKESLANS